jgi:hypothetical protein
MSSQHEIDDAIAPEPATDTSDAQRFREVSLELQSALNAGDARRVESIREQAERECRSRLDRIARDVSQTSNPVRRDLALATIINYAIAEAWRFSFQASRKYLIVKHLAQDIGQNSTLKLWGRFRNLADQPLNFDNYADLQRYVRTVCASASIDLYHRERTQSHPQVDDLESRATGMPCHVTPRRFRRGPAQIRRRSQS